MPGVDEIVAAAVAAEVSVVLLARTHPRSRHSGTLTLGKPIQLAALQRLLQTVWGSAVEAPPAPVRPPPPSPSRASPTSHWRLLLVEDDRINQRIALATLDRIGFRADVAENGRVALEKLAQKPYDLVLMDCQMPEMDGFTATEQIRSQEAESLGRRIPIVALTANALKGDRERCLASGMDDYLTKPLDLNLLRSCLAKQLATLAGPAAPPEDLDWEQLVNHVGQDPLLAGELLGDYVAECDRFLDHIESARRNQDRDGIIRGLTVFQKSAKDYFAGNLGHAISQTIRAVQREGISDHLFNSLRSEVTYFQNRARERTLNPTSHET